LEKITQQSESGSCQGVLPWPGDGSLPVQLGLALLGAALIGLLAQLKIPLPWTPVPITGQTLAVLLMGALLGPKGGALSAIFYLALGGAGVPWFAGASGGLSAVLGPTGGYLVGFVPAACFVGYCCQRFTRAQHLSVLVLVMLIANFIIIHGLGLLWLGCVSGIHSLSQLLALGTLPFISGDLVKIAAAAALARASGGITAR